MDLLKYNTTLKELMLGELCIGALWQIILLIFFERHLYNGLGLWIGVVLGLYMAYSMADSIEIAVDFDEKGSQKFLRKKSVFRYVVVCAVVAVMGITDSANALTCMAGVLGLKISAYLQPFTHKLLHPNEKKPDYSYMDNEYTREGIDVYYVKDGDSYKPIPVEKNKEGGEEVNE